MPDELVILIPQMKSSIPEFVADDVMMSAFFAATAPEIQLIQTEAQAIPRQMWPHLVNAAGIGRLEALYGLHQNESLTLDERRKLVLIKMLAARTITVLVMRELVADLSNDQAVISYYPRQCEAWIKMVVDNGKPAYLGALQAAIDYYLPAHLEPHYLVYGQLTWGGLQATGATWQALPATTWAGLPLWNRGQHRLLWLELRQYVYKRGEITWEQLAEQAPVGVDYQPLIQIRCRATKAR